MRNFIIILCSLLLASSAAYSQQRGQREKRRYVVAPPENIFLATASQPDCQLKIENARLLLSVDPTKPPISQYRLRNGGTKRIHYFTIVAWNSDGTGGTLSNAPPWDGRITNRLLMPGQIVPTVKRDYDLEIVPLTTDLREKLGLTGPMKLMVVLLVDQITFADGSTYSSLKSSKALIDYFETLDPKD